MQYNTESMQAHWETGGCHCGSVRFQVYSNFDEAIECNCSICFKKAYLHLIVTRQNFSLLTSGTPLKTYRFGSQTAQHFFCQTCGITPYYIPRSHPDGFSVNLRCLDKPDLHRFRIIPFNGRHWENHIVEIRDNPQDPDDS